MATPYFQERHESVPSTQDVARDHLGDLPLLVVAASQTGGRGRSGSTWENADRALAASLAIPRPEDDLRPFSLMAGVAARRVLDTTTLKWPNDLLVDEEKVGGILVERHQRIVTVGLGLNLWWKSPPAGARGLYPSDPGPARHQEIGALWAAELNALIDSRGWPRDEYVASCATLGHRISWEPAGAGVAMDVADDGALIVETSTGVDRIYSGAVSHVRKT